jgi:glucose-6-phosphate isomerase
MEAMRGIGLDVSGSQRFLSAAEVDAMGPAVAAVAADLEARRGPGAEFLGWLDLPVQVPEKELVALEAAAKRARENCEVYVVVGIGGSYLGARAVLEAVGSGEGPEVLFAGTGLCSVALDNLLLRVKDRAVRLCVISKSGTTLEPALAFRFLRTRLQDHYGPDEAARRITAVTDARKGALRALAETEGYETFVIPDDVGGRFSVLTPVGLLPLAVAGVDIRALLAGAAEMREACRRDDLRANPAHLYAAIRHGLYEKGYKTEVLSTFYSRLTWFQEWWKQLFGESEGKEGRGILPASTLFTTDLHSLGQYLQDGRRELLETFLCVREGVSGLTVPADPPSTHAATRGRAAGKKPVAPRPAGDGLDYLVGRTFDDINWKAYEGTRTAHEAGGVPWQALEIDRLDARTMGGLIYLFEKAVAVSGRLLGVNPFDQPGVEAYKKEMFRLLGRP